MKNLRDFTMKLIKDIHKLITCYGREIEPEFKLIDEIIFAYWCCSTCLASPAGNLMKSILKKSNIQEKDRRFLRIDRNSTAGILIRGEKV